MANNTLTNQAHVSFSYEGSAGIKTNDSNIVTSTMRDPYDFDVHKTANAECFRAGDRITYTIHIANTGCGCLGTFRVIDNLGGDDYANFVEGSGMLFANGSMTSIVPTDLSPLTFEVSTNLQRNEEMILQYSVDIDENISSEVEEIENEVCVYACPCGICRGNDNARQENCIERRASLTIPKCNYAEVLITKAISNGNGCCDDEFDYVLTLTNTGNADATDVVVTDSLPSEFNLMSIYMENNGEVYQYGVEEYNLDAQNFLTLPNAVGRSILVPTIAPGVDNTTRIRIHGHM